MEHFMFVPSMLELRCHQDLQTTKPKCGYYHKCSQTCSRYYLLL